MEPPSLLPHVDELVMEYLLFRGFTKSFHVFSAERKRDHARGFDVDQIISQLLIAVQNYQIDPLLETWKFLTARFFNHLDTSYASTLQQLETSLLRLYVVNAVKSGRREKAVELFQLYADKLNASVAAERTGADSWSRWFILPYIENPESDPYFQVFFSQAWLEAFVTSFRNFLSLVFRNLPLPKLLAFQLARLEEPTLRLRLKVSQSEAMRLRIYNDEATSKIKKLEEAGRQLHSILRTMVQHSFMDHFSSSNHVDLRNDRNKTKSLNRSYNATTTSIGLTQKQMMEMAELFGITKDDSSHAYPAPVDLCDIPRVAEVHLPVIGLSNDCIFDPEDEVVEANKQSVLKNGTESTPVVSSIDTSLSSSAENSLNGQSPWPSDQLDENTRVSLIREFNMLNDWEPTKSAMTVRTRFSSDGQYLAVAKIGNTQIQIWSADTECPSLLCTIKLPAKLTSLTWLGPNSNKQILVCTLEEGEMMLWDTDGHEVFTCLPNEENLQARQLISARDAPIAACLLTSRDEEENALQQILVLHGGVTEPLQNYFPMEGKQLTCITWSNMGDILILGSESGQIEFIDVIHPERMYRCNLFVESDSAPTENSNLSAICLSPDGQFMLGAYENGDVVMEWSVKPAIVAAVSPAVGRDSGTDIKLTLEYTYEIGTPLALRDTEVDITIRFVGSGDYFVVSDSATLYIFKRGKRRALSTFLPNQNMMADLDCHPHLPVSCSANQDGAISLWSMNGI